MCSFWLHDSTGRQTVRKGVYIMSDKKRGFASMSKERQREIAGSGGRAAQASGKAHRWSSEEAKKAGAIGGRKKKKV